jgi:hypothetical protein
VESGYSIIVKFLTFHFLEKKGLKIKKVRSFPTPQYLGTGSGVGVVVLQNSSLEDLQGI